MGTVKIQKNVFTVSVRSLCVCFSFSRTPLHWATVCENPEVIRTLLPHGGKLKLR